jgi:hypothetical protein
MKKRLTELDRLDLVARAEATKDCISRARIPWTFFSIVIVLLAMVSGASFNETMLIRMMAVLAIMATVMLWLNSPYSAYGMSSLFFALLLGAWLVNSTDDHTFLGFTSRTILSVWFFYRGYRWWTNAKPLMDAHSKALEKERFQIQQWIRVLKTAGTSQIIKFSTKSFWSGYWTYRLLNIGSYWLIAKFKIGKIERLLSCRVQELGVVHIADQSERKLAIEIGEHTIHNVDVSQDMLARLLQSVSAKSQSV